MQTSTLEETSIEQLEARFRERTATVGVIGMGYVGLPLMLAAAAAGYHVLGFDIDHEKVEKINAGHSYLEHIKGEHIASARDQGRLRATIKFEEVKKVDAIILC